MKLHSLFASVAIGTRLAISLGVSAGIVSLASGKARLSVDEICERMRQGEDMKGSFAGTEKVVRSYVGATPPYLPANALEDDLVEGDYRWYIQGKRWWMVKNRGFSDPTTAMGVALNVLRDYGDRVLRYTEYWDQAGKLNFASGHLDSTQYQASVGPQAGRRWHNGPIEGMLRLITNVHMNFSSEGIEIDGLYKTMPIHLTVAPQFGYLTTKLLLRPGNNRFGFSITQVQRIGASFIPLKMDLFNGEYNGNSLSKGFTSTVEFSKAVPHGTPSRAEVGAPAPGAIIGSDDNRLFRFAEDGSLVDFGRQGLKPGTPLAFGDIFVLSGAGLLLTSLSWLVFRKRRSSPPSPSRR